MNTHNTAKLWNNQQERIKDVKSIGMWSPKHPAKNLQIAENKVHEGEQGRENLYCQSP